MPEATSFDEARAQAAEFLGFIASERIVTKDGVFEIPNPSLLDDDQQARVDALDLETESWDKHDDVLDDAGKVVSRGGLMVPNRKGGKIVSYNVGLAKAIFGDRYEAFKKAGGNSGDVNLFWSKMNRALAQRRAEDSKSGGSAASVAPVSDAD
jgi:hypothetical protein